MQVIGIINYSYILQRHPRISNKLSLPILECSYFILLCVFPATIKNRIKYQSCRITFISNFRHCQEEKFTYQDFNYVTSYKIDMYILYFVATCIYPIFCCLFPLNS